MAGSANTGTTSAPGGGRAYYGAVVTTVMFLPIAIFLVLTFAAFLSLANGDEEAGSMVLLSLAGMAMMGFVLAREFWKRRADWNEQGVRFQWMSGAADLKWSDIEKVEVRTLQRNYARIKFRDGRTFGVSAYLTGSNDLLRELARHGVAFYKWGTSKPVNPQA